MVKQASDETSSAPEPTVGRGHRVGKAARTILPGIVPLALLAAPMATATAATATATATATAATATTAATPPPASAPAVPGSHPAIEDALQEAATPTGTLSDGSTSSYTVGSTITFTYTASSVSSTNWVGIYKPGQTPGTGTGTSTSTAYNYVTAASGTTSFDTSTLGAGTWVAYLFYDDGYGEMASGVTFTVTAATTPPAIPSGTLTDNASTFVQGENITFTYSASVVNPTNWVGIYRPTDTPGTQDSTTYNYVTAANGTTSFSTASLTPGTWVAYLFYDNVYGVMAGPVTFTVTAPPPVTMPGYSGQLTGGSNGLSGPDGVALDASGDVWVADTYNNRVVELSPSDAVLQSFGTAGSGPGQLNSPEAIALDGQGHVFVADTGNNRVEEYDTDGTFVATIGSSGVGNGEFDDPEGVAVDGNGDLYVADTDNNRVEEFDATTGAYTSSITNGMSDPQGLTIDSAGDLWVADNGITDTSDDSVAEYNPSGNEVTSFGSNTSQFGGMSNPAAVAVSGTNVYVSEPDYEFVQEFTTGGVYEGEFGTPTDGAGTLNLPQGIAANSQGDVFVADSGNDRIAEFALAAPTASTPEAPLAVALPIGALGIAAAAWRLATRRRRHRSSDAS